MLPSYPKKEFKKRDDIVDFGFNDCLELNVPRIAVVVDPYYLHFYATINQKHSALFFLNQEGKKVRR